MSLGVECRMNLLILRVFSPQRVLYTGAVAVFRHCHVNAETELGAL